MKALQRKTVFLLLAAVFLTVGPFVGAQQPTKIPRIGYLATVPLSSMADRVEGLTRGLRELGYLEKKNIVIEWRSAEGKLDRLPALAAELVDLNVDVIVTTGGVVTRAAKAVTSSIPIVMTNDPDPIASGFAASLARPGGNITGLSAYALGLSGKRLEILREVVPRLSRVAILGTSAGPGNEQTLKEAERAATAFKMHVQYLDVLNAKDITTAFQAAVAGRAEALLVLGSFVLLARRAELLDLTATHRLPAIYISRDFVEDGGLMSYGVSYVDLHRRAATYVDKILKGRKPAELPVEQPIKSDFVINLKSAKTIGLFIPPELLQRADKVIE